FREEGSRNGPKPRAYRGLWKAGGTRIIPGESLACDVRVALGIGSHRVHRTGSLRPAEVRGIKNTSIRAEFHQEAGCGPKGRETNGARQNALQRVVEREICRGGAAGEVDVSRRIECDGVGPVRGFAADCSEQRQIAGRIELAYEDVGEGAAG